LERITDSSSRPTGHDGGLEAVIAENVRTALAEDIGSGDLTAALVPAEQAARASVIVRTGTVICGQPWFETVFAQLDVRVAVRWLIREGERAEAGRRICTIDGPARPILAGERSALNFLQLLSGTAAIANRYTGAIEGTGAKILDTRKTLPGLRRAQKYAVRCGGAFNHRLGLFDAILIKENHIAAAGGLVPAIEAARRQRDGVMIEAEVENPAQLDNALGAGVDRLLLDNFSVTELRRAVELRNRRAAGIELEASGGITLENVREIAATGVEFISVGALTKDVRAADLSMRFE